MSPVLDKPLEYEVKKAEVKKTGETKDGKPFTILNLGLLSPDGEKVWPAEFFATGNAESWPMEGAKTTLVLTDSQYGLKAKRPFRGGGGRPGGRVVNDASIEAQVAFKGAIECVVAGKAEVTDVADLTSDFVHAIRGAAKRG